MQWSGWIAIFNVWIGFAVLKQNFNYTAEIKIVVRFFQFKNLFKLKKIHKNINWILLVIVGNGGM